MHRRDTQNYFGLELHAYPCAARLAFRRARCRAQCRGANVTRCPSRSPSRTAWLRYSSCRIGIAASASDETVSWTHDAQCLRPERSELDDPTDGSLDAHSSDGVWARKCAAERSATSSAMYRGAANACNPHAGGAAAGKSGPFHRHELLAMGQADYGGRDPQKDIGSLSDSRSDRHQHSSTVGR